MINKCILKVFYGKKNIIFCPSGMMNMLNRTQYKNGYGLKEKFKILQVRISSLQIIKN